MINSLYYYHLWTTSYDNKYPAVCLKSIDGWSGRSRNTNDDRQWKYERMSQEDIDYIHKNLGLYDSKYGITLRLYSLDTTKWYNNLEELREDLYIKLLAGI